MNTFFQTKVKYTKQLENGTFKRITEPYIVPAVNFTDAEARIHEELGSKVRGEFLLHSIDRVEYRDYFIYDDSTTHYEVKLKFQKNSEESARPKTITNKFIVTADTPEESIARIKDSLSTLMIDFEVVGTKLTPIIEVFGFIDQNQDQEHIEL